MCPTVVGGNAAAAWVSRVDETAVRNTRDVDLLLWREGLSAATAALETAGFQHRRVSSLGRGGATDSRAGALPVAGGGEEFGLGGGVGHGAVGHARN